MKGILGTKVGMTQIWRGDKVVPVTVVLAGPCPVVQRKEPTTDGYSAVQLGFMETRKKSLNKPLLGHLEKAKASPVRFLREFRDYSPESETVTVEIFEGGEKVDVTGITKGRGTMGVMRRWGFQGGPASHGSKKWHRRPGSIGQRKTPGRVWKGKKMAGHYGNERVTTSNLEVVEVRPSENLLLIRGAIPGANGGLVVIRAAKKFNPKAKGGK
jgi:large subunit ribosomal protein L3